MKSRNLLTANRTAFLVIGYIPPMIIIAGLICFVMYATEGAVMSWSAVFVSQERGVDLAYAGFFYTAFLGIAASCLVVAAVANVMMKNKKF